MIGTARIAEGLLHDLAFIHGAAIAPHAMDDGVDTLLFVVANAIANGLFTGPIGRLIPT